MRSGGLVALILLAACAGETAPDDAVDTDGGAADLVGLWKLVKSTEAEDCTTFTDETFPVPFQRVVQSTEVEGALEVRTCTDAKDCRSFANEDGILSWDANGQRWRYLDLYPVFNGESCSRRATERVLSVRDDGSLRIESRKAEETGTDKTTEAACDKYAKNWEPELDDFEPQRPGSPSAGIFGCERWVGERVVESEG